ncbi:hypothetical protein D3C72_1121050 [compost metagenome]
MLVGGPDDVVIDQGAIFGIVFGARVMHGFSLHTFYRFDTRCACIDANGAVFVEDPVKDIVVVADGTDPTHHQFTALGADVRFAHLLVLIFRPGVAFKHGNRAGDLHRRAGVIRNGFVEHHRVRRRIFATHQRRGQGAHAVITGIEIGFKVPAHVRVAIRNNHPAERALIHHLAFFAVVVIGHSRDDRPDAGVETQVKVPVLPVDHIARNGVVLALWLDNLQRFFDGGDTITAIIRTRIHWHRHHRTFFNFEDFFLLEIDHRHQVFNRVRPVVTVAGVEIADHFQQALFLFQTVFPVKIADGQRGTDHFLRVVHAVFFQRLRIFRAAHDDLLYGGEIIQQHHAVGVVDRRPAQDFFVLQINDALNDVFTIQHGDIRLTRSIDSRAVQDKIPHFGFVGFGQRNLGETGIGFELRRGFHDLDGLFDFVCGQCVERMRAFFHLEGLIKSRLENIVDEGVGDERLVVFHHHRHLQFKRLAVDDGGIRARFDLHKGTVFGNGKHLGVIVPLHIGAKIGEGFIHRNHMRFAAMGERGRLPGA